MLITGEVEFTDVDEPVRDATLRIRLQDVGRADGVDETVHEQILSSVSVSGPVDRVGFALDVPALDPRGIYAIEAHLDLDGTGAVEVGDYRTMEHFGVGPQTSGQNLVVLVRPVR